MKIVLIAKEVRPEIKEFYSRFSLTCCRCVVSPNRTELVSEGWDYEADSAYLDRNEIIKMFGNVKRSGKYQPSLIAGWYYQQILKYKVVLASKARWVAIIDGDSIVREDIIRADILCRLNRRPESAYSKFASIILDTRNIEGCYSYVTNQMVFDSVLLKEMLDEIEVRYNCYWVDAIFRVIMENPDAMFSEYQLYAIYVKKRHAIEERSIRIFRRMDLVASSVKKALLTYDVIAFESGHRTSIAHKIRASLFYRCGLNLG